MIMTEEVLDDWEAQTLNKPFEKLVRDKKTLKNVINLSFYKTSDRRIREVEKQCQDKTDSCLVTIRQEIKVNAAIKKKQTGKNRGIARLIGCGHCG